MVAVKPICDRLGIASNTQITRLKTDQTRWRGDLIVSPSAGGSQETYCIPLTNLSAWLFSINANRVKPELREGLIQYQLEAADVLDRHFRQRAAETSVRIEELERMLWHSHQQLRIENRKWGTAYLMMEQGHSPYMIAQRCNWTMIRAEEETTVMRRCGMVPEWRHDMQTLVDHNRTLQWQLNRAAQATPATQPDLFSNA